MIYSLVFDEKISITDLISLCSLVVSLITFFVLLFQRRNDIKPDVRLDLEAKDERNISKKFDSSLFEKMAKQDTPVLLVKSINSNVPKLVTIAGFLFVNPTVPKGDVTNTSSSFFKYSNPVGHSCFAMRTAFSNQQFWNLDKETPAPIGSVTQNMFEMAAYLEIQQFLKGDFDAESPRLIFRIDYCDHKNRNYSIFYSVLLNVWSFDLSTLVYSPEIVEISHREFFKYQKIGFLQNQNPEF